MLALTPPRHVTLYLSVALAIIAIVVHFANIALPVFPAHGFVILLLGYLVLLAGNVLKGV